MYNHLKIFLLNIMTTTRRKGHKFQSNLMGISDVIISKSVTCWAMKPLEQLKPEGMFRPFCHNFFSLCTTRCLIIIHPLFPSHFTCISFSCHKNFPLWLWFNERFCLPFWFYFICFFSYVSTKTVVHFAHVSGFCLHNILVRRMDF